MSVKRKLDQFKASTVAVHTPFYPNLVSCAFSELSLSLEDRRDNFGRLKNNHYSRHAVGSIVLLATGFDAFLNEEIMHIGFFDEEVRTLIEERPTYKKYSEIITRLGGTIQPNKELAVIIKLRDEIVHYLPRNVSEIPFDSRRYLPEFFKGLDKKGLFYNPSDRSAEPFGQMVCSYRLAYWTWENIEFAVNKFVSSFPTTKHPDWFSGSFQHHIFEMYKQITSPDNLATYDVLHKLKLTA